MPFKPQARRFQKKWLAEVLDHFFVIACRRAEERITKTTGRFEDRGIRRKTGSSEERRFSAVPRGVTGMEWFHHRSLLAMYATGCRCSNSKRRFQLAVVQFQQARTSDSRAKAAPHRRAVKTTILDVRTIAGKLTHDFDAEHVSLQQLLAGSANAFADAQPGAKQHTCWMADMDKCIPVVVIQRMRQKSVRESRGWRGGF